MVSKRGLPDLSARQLVVLLLIAGHKDMRVEATSVRRLSEKMKVHKPAVTRAFDRLVDLGLIVRKKHSHDGRIVEAVITNAGTAFVQALQNAA